MNGKDAERFWRVYKPEWCVAYVSDNDGVDGRQECFQKFDTAYRGRVRQEDCRLVPWSLELTEWCPWMLELLLPTMKGEYTSRPPALEHARKIDGVVVLEGSKADKKLLNYGKRMLREVSVDGQPVDDEGAARGAAGEAG
jgi:hypothetical protein